MTNSIHSNAHLVDKIEQAFADVQYPGDNDLTDTSYGDESAALAIDFRGKTDWRQLDSTFLNQAPDGWGTALSFFSDNALRFYLPAYLIADIRDDLDHDPEVRLCSSLTPLGEQEKNAKIWGDGTMGERARTCFAKFSGEQVSAIVAYLWWKRDFKGGNDMWIEQALENYWLQRDEVSPD